MTNGTHADRAANLLHELTEALQATGNYLGTLRHGPAPNGNGLPERELVERALGQWTRAQHAVQELRDHLNGHSRPDG